eukprot:TRINITY_DN1747_c0_g1_i4.p1 TRINITY_DN1747_c0_g1~~TRINITY_DN1747_c0_g1_i4.p1  ORF type:complete len:483 (-),score=108.00 TRINITY_DN1747_c0_g1_i4:170-1567(-)
MYRLVLVLLAVYVASSAAADPTPVAANLVGISDWARTLPFVDLMKQSRQFGSPHEPWSGKINVDALGWPTEDFGVIIEDNDLSSDIMGTLQLQGTCNAKPDIFPVASGAKVQNVAWDSSSKILTAEIVVPNTATGITLGFTGTQGGIRNLKVIQPGYTLADANGFTKEWIAMLQKFVLLRFMDWTSTNGNPVVNWSDRTPPGYASYAYGPKGSTGAPWEVCINLANAAGRDMWINIPHQATDDYVKQLATLFKQNLNSNLNLYYEYSNEVWNWSFSQATWNLNAAATEVNAGDPNKLNYDNCNNKAYWGYRRVALRLKQITDIFASIWGADAINTRIRPVLAGQVVQPLICQLGLDYIQTVFGSPSKWFYATAGAPYFNLGSTNNNPSMTVDDVLNALEQSIDSMLPSVGVGENNPLAGNLALARWYNLEFRGYEGGPDTFGPNGIQAKANATLNPRMKDLVIKS